LVVLNRLLVLHRLEVVLHRLLVTVWMDSNDAKTHENLHNFNSIRFNTMKDKLNKKKLTRANILSSFWDLIQLIRIVFFRGGGW
jgi:hypothetical protein